MAQALAHIELSKDLSAEKIRALEQRVRWRRYAAGEQILDRNSDNRDMFLVVDGQVQIVNFSLAGREIAYAAGGAGGFFGELSAIDDEPRSASVVAAESCTLAAVSPEVFRSLLLDDGRIATGVLRRLARIIRICDDRIMDLSTLGAVQRVYLELIRLAAPDIVAPENWVIRPMRTHGSIASLASTTRETVARVLSQLTSAGIVERKGKTLYIRDHSRLKKLAERLEAGGREHGKGNQEPRRAAKRHEL